jgi:hypothetical protein
MSTKEDNDDIGGFALCAYVLLGGICFAAFVLLWIWPEAR